MLGLGFFFEALLRDLQHTDLQVFVAARDVPEVLQHCRREDTRRENPFEKYSGLVSVPSRGASDLLS